MIENTGFSWRKRARSFKYAWQGFSVLLRDEHNARIHLAAAVVAVGAGFLFDISATEWCLIALCIGMVISAEAMNSAVEAVADKVSKEYDPLIGKAKDCGAAAVMILAFVAVVVGLIIFLPKFLALFQ